MATTSANILIVEDEGIVARNLDQRLTGLGYAVVGVTAFGEQAVSMARTNRPDLVLMDIRLRGEMDGIAAAEQIHQELQLPVVYLTAYADEDTLRRARVTEPFGYILKPFQERELRTAIEIALYKHRAERRLLESERRYAITLSSIGDAVIASDAAGQVTFMNPVAEAMTGWTRNESFGESFETVFRIIDEATREAVENPAATVLRSGSAVGLANHTLLIARDGREVPVDDSAAPILDDTGLFTGVVLVFRDVTARRRTESALRQSEERYRSLVESARDAIFTITPEGTLTSLNSAFETLTGWTREEWIDQPLHSLVHPDDWAKADATFRRVLNGEAAPAAEIKWRSRTGPYLFVEVTVTAHRHEGRVVDLLGIARDVTQRKRLEEQLLHAQKMESVGRLAGGVAHDFNNLLTAILGHAELALHKFHGADPCRRDLEQIVRAAERAGNLTRQLLAFARRHKLEPRILSLNDLTLNLVPMLQRLIGEDIKIVLRLPPSLWAVQADLAQLEQVLMNLSINAREAMPKGGTLTIETANCTLGEGPPCGPNSLQPGEYVVWTFQDTGLGMSSEVQQHLFEPFFTTKEPGKGPGLGLATCYGIVKQSDGHILVESQPDQGTSIRIYLPRSAPAGPVEVPDQALKSLPRGSETILLAEDDSLVRLLAAASLRSYGYVVLEAADGIEALRMASTCTTPLHLLVTDLVMPHLGGKDLADQLLPRHPTLKVLYTSGYLDLGLDPAFVERIRTAILHKPFTPSILIRKVRQVLDASP
jgi:PAS domain S-box-containing protein